MDLNKVCLLYTSILNDLAHRLSATPGLDQNLSNLLKNANFTDNGSSAEGKSLYGQTTIGRAWKINDKLSMSIAGRAVLGMKKLKGNIDINSNLPVADLKNIHADIDSDRTAWGLGAQIGFNYKATDRLNLAMRYDSRVKLNFKASGDQTPANIPFLGEFGFSAVSYTHLEWVNVVLLVVERSKSTILRERCISMDTQ